MIGDVDDAKVAALNELMQTWVPRGTADPFESDSIDFELHEDVDLTP